MAVNATGTTYAQGLPYEILAVDLNLTLNIEANLISVAAPAGKRYRFMEMSMQANVANAIITIESKSPTAVKATMIVLQCGTSNGYVELSNAGIAVSDIGHTVVITSNASARVTGSIRYVIEQAS
jgi:hypothetical protein